MDEHLEKIAARLFKAKYGPGPAQWSLVDGPMRQYFLAKAAELVAAYDIDPDL
jgi:hypothetical protein